MTTSIMWFRRDLRLADHPALLAAVEAADDTVGLFVLDERLWGPAGTNRRAFLVESLRELDRQLDGRLVVRHGDPVAVVPAVARTTDAAGVWVTADFGPYGRERDEAVATGLDGDGRELHAVGSPYAVEPGTIFTKSGTPYKVFTPYSKQWFDRVDTVPADAASDVEWRSLESDGIPDSLDTTAALPPAGERAAHQRLDEISEQLASYDDDRNRPDLDRTSRLSPYLKWGAIHPRTILAGLDRRKPGHDVFAKELCWREFYADVLYHWPESARADWRDDLPLAWDDPHEGFDAWREGQTGFPIVDAGMRQLSAEGWMHNRVRMIVASFLVKDLHVHWRHGAAHFMEHLVDGDLASNQHGWQWTAGTGTDAQPFFRVFNPTSQGERFDPKGDYIRRYVPELREVADDDIHAPDGILRPADYPAPIVDHAEERLDALARYEEAKQRR